MGVVGDGKTHERTLLLKKEVIIYFQSSFGDSARDSPPVSDHTW